MSLNAEEPRIVIIGAGAGGIAMAISLKKKLNFNNFVIYEKASGIGGTWRENTYPGCQCDVPSNVYSLSSELNPDWSSYFAFQPEILEYYNSLVSKYNLGRHCKFNTTLEKGVWDSDAQLYHLSVRDSITREESVVTAEIIISAVGGLHWPFIPEDLKGRDEFKGPSFHTAEWRKDVDLHGKRVGVIGNGASGVQLVPAISSDASVEVIHFCRSPMWIAPRPENSKYSTVAKWAFRYLPGLQRIYRTVQLLLADLRANIFWKDNRLTLYVVRKMLTRYVKMAAPKQYHQYLIPDYPVGCRRVIIDPGYLNSLHQPNVTANWDQIDSIVPEGIKTKKGEVIPLDVIVYATGFRAGHQNADIIGRNGQSLRDYFIAEGGPTAYLGSSIPGFPNLFTVFGPNSTTVHGSALFSEERQVHYITNIVKPILCGKLSSVEASELATKEYNAWLEKCFENSVFLDCTSYYRYEHTGKNYSSFPGSFFRLWWMTRKPDWKCFDTIKKNS